MHRGMLRGALLVSTGVLKLGGGGARGMAGGPWEPCDGAAQSFWHSSVTLLLFWDGVCVACVCGCRELKVGSSPVHGHAAL